MNVQDSLSKDTNRFDLYVIVFSIVFPTLFTLVYFQWLKDTAGSVQQTAMGIGKVIQFAFPVLWVLCWHRYKLRTGRPGNSPGGSIRDPSSPPIQADSSSNMFLGIAFAGLVVAALFVIYFWLLAPTETGARLAVMVQEKVASMNIDSLPAYVGLGIFYALCHSFLEEYYWRWFVFDILRKYIPMIAANIISSLGFMAHHVVLLSFFLGWANPLTYLFSICIAIGGSFWAWQYDRTGKLLASWVSHLIIDAGIFTLGCFLVKDIL